MVSVFGMNRLLYWSVIFLICRVLAVDAQPKYDVSHPGTQRKSAVSWSKRYLQGYNMKVWMNNELRFGIDVAPDLTQIGLEYPAGSGNEHLYVGGLSFGGIVDGVKHVSSAWWF